MGLLVEMESVKPKFEVIFFIGKSTLLRTVSQRDINIPTHISILHVEQEVIIIILMS